jgi:hypothetical protein
MHSHHALPEPTPEPRRAAIEQPAPARSPAAILALQRGAGNQAVARLLAREPAAAAAPVPDTGVVPMLQAFWPDTAWSQGRLALDLLRPIPGLGLLTGLTADVMGAWDDFSAVPTGDPVLAALNYGLIGFRSGLNLAVNGAQGLLAVSQTLQLKNTLEAGVDLLSGIGAPKVVIDGAQGVLDFLAGSALSLFIEATDGGLLAIDGLIALDAGIWAAIGPVADRDKWKELAYGYLANALGDLVTLPIIAAGFTSANFLPSGILAQGVDSTTALVRTGVLARNAILSALQSFWNVRGGNVLPHVPGTGAGPEQGLDPTDPPAGSLARTPQDSADPTWAGVLAAAQDCFARGDGVLGEAAAGWAELLANAGAMAEGAAEAPEALDALRAELPAIAAGMRARLASVQGLADRLDGGLETVTAVGDRIGELLAAAEGLALPLDEVPEPVRGTLEPAVAALEEAKAGLLEPLRELQATLAALRPQLEVVAGAAHETLGLLGEGIGRVTDAAAHCDDVAGFVHDVATLSVDGEDAGSIDSALADWHTLGPQIADARAAL